MRYRTDLALEACGNIRPGEGIETEESVTGDVVVTRIRVTDERGERAVGKPVGEYITVSFPALTDRVPAKGAAYEAIRDGIAGMLPEDGPVLVAGLGNRAITPDALGPRAADRIPATRHIAAELERSAGYSGLRPTAVFPAGVLGQTGIESAELIRALCGAAKPSAVIVIDALAAREVSRLGRTVQICDTGISPGAGVGNRRPEITEKTVGAPVISLGIPTVTDAATLAADAARRFGQPAPDAEAIRTSRSEAGLTYFVPPKETDQIIRL